MRDSWQRATIKLRDFPFELVCIECPKCGLEVEGEKADLIQQYGGGISLPDLKWKMTGCAKHVIYRDWCGASYPDLKRIEHLDGLAR